MKREAVNKSWIAFSLVNNIKDFFEKGIDKDLETLVSKFWYNKQKPFIKDKCVDIGQKLNNNLITVSNVKAYLLNFYLYKKKVTWKDIQSKDIDKIGLLYTKKRYEEDKKLMNELINRVGYESILDCYKINSNGTCILYDLVLNGTIAPMLYILEYHKCAIGVSKYSASKEQKHFNVAVQRIKQIKTKQVKTTRKK